MKAITQLFRILVGLLFIYSGFVKLVDPKGLAFKLEEYFSPSVLDLTFLIDFVLPLSIFLVVLEVVLGFCLLLGVFKKFTLVMLLGMIVFFTFLTFYSAYFNKVTDCGCFGDAIKLSPWQSFTKDAILCIMILVLWLGQKWIQPIAPTKFAYPFLTLILIWCFVIVNRGVNHLPLLDFRAFKEGGDIKELMKQEEPSVYESVFELKNSESGEVKSVIENEYINDSTYWRKGSLWEVLEVDSKLLKKGKDPKIKDFSIDCGGEELTAKYLDEPFLVVFSVYGKDYFSGKGLEKVEILKAELKKQNIETVVLSAKNLEKSGLSFCKTDATTLKTMNRSNPGIMLLREATILKKYHWRDFPSAQNISKYFIKSEKN